MDDGVWILGGYQSDFARNLSKENRDFADLTREVVDDPVGVPPWLQATTNAAAAASIASVRGKAIRTCCHGGAYAPGWGPGPRFC